MLGSGNIRLGTFFDIPVFINWSFTFLIVFIFYIGITNNLEPAELVGFGSLVLVLFVCVILHEYGHALSARRYGVKTRDIILSPIGGVARLESIPENPRQELIIAIAGPAVNLSIAGILAMVINILYQGSVWPSDIAQLDLLKFPSEFIRFVFTMNIALFFFNLIPAFPMDGGRVLRALLSIKIGRAKATKYASYIGKLLAVGFVIIAIKDQALLTGIIGVFIYMTAGMENRSVQLMEKLKKKKVRDIFQVDFPTIPEKATIRAAVAAGMNNYAVTSQEGVIVGALPLHFIRLALRNDNLDIPIYQRLNKISDIHVDESLLSAFQQMQKEGIVLLRVKSDETFVGFLDRGMIENYLNKE